MKTLMTLAFVALATTTSALAPEEERTLDTRATRLSRDQSLLVPPEDNRNKIVGDRFTYSGIAVQVIKAENPLQLLNPTAPDEYWSADNPALGQTRRGQGFKLFSIEF